MRIAIAPAKYPHETEFLDALGETLRELGHEVEGLSARNGIDLVIQWGAHVSEMCLHMTTHEAPHVYVELGWLPRWSYQVSWSGINAKHHAAGGSEPVTQRRYPVFEEYLSWIRQGHGMPKNGWHYCDPTVPACGEPAEFYLCPLQVPGDVNMDSLSEDLRTPEGLIAEVLATQAVWEPKWDGIPRPARIYFKQHPASSERHGRYSVPPPHKYLQHHSGQVASYLKSDKCLGVIVGNSNVFHDALLWGKPATALGDGFWGKGPITMIPGTDETNAYIRHVLANQWMLEDARDAGRVRGLLDAATTHTLQKG